MTASDVERLGALIAESSRIVVFTGAGVSTESGIPDFRSPTGLWARFDPSEFTFQNYLRNAEHRRRVWEMRAEFIESGFRPNPAHHAIAELERMGVLDAVVTQNIDGLHQDAGNTTVLEVHGTNRRVGCLSCFREWPSEEIVARVRAGEEDPRCEVCDGLLKTATISFGQAMPEETLREAFRRAAWCDLCLVVGSSLVVYPAADVPVEAVRAGARLAIVNAEPTPLDSVAEVVVLGRAGEILPEAVETARRLRNAG